MSDTVAATGDIPMPSWMDRIKGAVGGHAVLGVGYDDNLQRIRFKNSWGIGWGDSGFGTLPYAYFSDSALSSDYWALQADASYVFVPVPAGA